MSKLYTKQWIDANNVVRYFKDEEAQQSIETVNTKLNGIESGAQVNTIEGITVNGSATTPDQNKIVAITIPSAPVQSISKNNQPITPDGNGNVNIGVPTGAAAEKAVDASISTGSVSTNLPTSSAVAAFVEGKGYLTSAPVTSVNGQTGDVNITAVSFHILQAGEDLPSVGVIGGIYFKPNGNQSGTNLYDEWVYVNNAWENLGPVEVDLSNYVTLTGNEALTNKSINGYTPGAAMAKGVDISIGASSTSTNLPTSEAVANFVEGKGYASSASLGTAASANTTTSITSGGTDLPTAGAVYTAIDSAIGQALSASY